MLNPTKPGSCMFRPNPILLLVLATLPVFYCGQTGLVHAVQEATKQSSDAVAKQTHNQGKHTNALANETSPYLLMHAHNPVNWYPWGNEALAKAKKENKPIFLSIGYSSCHWCHVMERESFLDDEIAKILNDNFVCIKVDREERPDVDTIYMESLNTFNRIRRSKATGGWPLSMFLTPDTKPFFGGTYFPARKGDRGASIGFLEIVNSVNKNWKANPDRLNRDAKLVTDLTIRELEGREPAEVSEIKAAWSKIAIQALSDSFDPVHAGFRFDPNQDQLPKFPEPSNLLFLNNVIRIQPDNEKAKKMLVETCEKMSLGGIYDHLGGGFHRYSVDRFWAIPHFEKMLYDNAQLASAYAEAFELTERPDFKRVVEGTLAWVESEMVSPEGGFYSALDAESEGEEGKFYRWTIEEAKAALSDEEYQLFSKTYRLDEPPNFEKEYYAPQLKKPLTSEEDAKLVPIRKKLFDVRAKRIRPLLDNKILASWNGMMIRGFADAGRILNNDRYVKLASRAADFCIKNLVRDNGALWRTYTKGEAKLNAYIDDYAAMIEGLLALHQATDEKKWLEAAAKLQQKQDELFWDEKHGGYFFTSKDHEQLLVRSKRPIDSALPSGNSISAANLAYLAKATSDPVYLEKSKKTILSASAILERYPIAAPRLLRVADGMKNQ